MSNPTESRPVRGWPRGPVNCLIYGTARKFHATDECVYKAIKHGYRVIDTAAQSPVYEEDLVAEGVKRAIKDGLVKREDLWIQTKFAPFQHQSAIDKLYDPSASQESQIHALVERSLERFTIEGYTGPILDCILLSRPKRPAWDVLSEYVPHKVRHLGLTLCDATELETLSLGPRRPAVAQCPFARKISTIKCDYSRAQREFCRKSIPPIAFQAIYTLVGNVDLLNDLKGPVQRLAKEVGVRPPAAMFALAFGLGSMAVLDGTKNENHMKENLVGISRIEAWKRESHSTGQKWSTFLTEFKTAIGDQSGAEEGSSHAAVDAPPAAPPDAPPPDAPPDEHLPPQQEDTERD